VGQEHFIRQLASILAERTSHAYLFHGPSGCGKTTLARICGAKLGCKDIDIIEVDGATNNGIDNIRQLQQAVRYMPLTGGAATAVIIDECHRVTGAAFDSMLKIIEEPPAHLFWFFCTTEPQKVPNTIRGRCQQFAVRAVEPANLEALLTGVAKFEGIKLPIEVVRFIAGKSLGSPRRALINLERCIDCKSVREAATAIEQVVDEEAVLELARFLCQFEKKRPWAKAMELFEKIGSDKDDGGGNVEGARVQIMHYIAACLRKAPKDETATVYLSMLEAFAEEIKAREGKAALLLSIGRALFASKDV
jgi:DNA polymerase-3 subunit gamma/tau